MFSLVLSVRNIKIKKFVYISAEKRLTHLVLLEIVHDIKINFVCTFWYFTGWLYWDILVVRMREVKIPAKCLRADVWSSFQC